MTRKYVVWLQVNVEAEYCEEAARKARDAVRTGGTPIAAVVERAEDGFKTRIEL